MKKFFVALAATTLVAGAFAQMPADSNATAASATAKTAEKSDAKREAGNEKHIKDLHAKLQITVGEESLWTAVAATMRDNTKDVDRVIDKREAGVTNATAIDDLNAYAEIAQAHADSVKKLALVFAPLYAAMPDAQKKIADGVFIQRTNDKKVASSK